METRTVPGYVGTHAGFVNGIIGGTSKVIIAIHRRRDSMSSCIRARASYSRASVSIWMLDNVASLLTR